MLDVLLAVAAPPGPDVAPSVPPSHWVSLAGLGVALVLVVGLWELAGHAATMAHEGAHAVVFLLVGQGVRRMEIKFTEQGHEGETYWAYGERPSVLALMAGYYGPSLFGLLGAALLVHGSATATLWIFLVLLGLLLVVVRNLFGFLIVLATGAILYLTVTYGSAAAQVLVACAWVWLLLVTGVVFAFGHFNGGDDYRKLQQATFFIPPVIWALLAVAVSLAALYSGGSWLLGFSRP